MRVVKVIFVSAAVAAASASAAFAYSKKVENACAGDYQDFCNQYLKGSTKLRRCFESNRKQLSRRCINALIDAGEVPRKYLKR